LTTYLREAGAPLDNNLSEQALKRVVLSRKNSLFYRSLPEQVVTEDFIRRSLTSADRCPALYVISQPDALSVRSRESRRFHQSFRLLTKHKINLELRLARGSERRLFRGRCAQTKLREVTISLKNGPDHDSFAPRMSH
jgi:hypothetical protein